MVTGRYLAEIKRSHTMVAYVYVITPSRKVVKLTAIDGNVRVDRSANTRRACTVTCVDSDGELTPVGPESDLVPLGTEIRPYRGVRYTDGTEELAPLGVFRLSRTTVVDTPTGGVQIRLEAFDRSRTVKRDGFIEPYVIESGTNVLAAIKALVERTFPGVEYDTISTPIVTTAPQVFDLTDSPWEAITSLALSIGCEAYFDVEGRFVVAPTSVTSSPVYTYIEGEGCTLTEITREFTDDPGYNGVVVTAESTGDELPPVRVVVWDDDPTSPTYHLGPYGEVPMHYTERVAKTEIEVEAVARQLLRDTLGFVAKLSVSAMVNPALEGGDIVQIERTRSHVTGTYAVESFNVPLTVRGTQSIELKYQRRI